MNKSEQLEAYMKELMDELSLENYDELFLMLHSSLMLSRGVLIFEKEKSRDSFLDMLTYIALHYPSRRTLIVLQKFKHKFKARKDENEMNKWWEQAKKDLN